MSRLGSKPIEVPSAVKVAVAGRTVTVTGGKGSLRLDVPDTASVSFDESRRLVTVQSQGAGKQAKANHGLARAMLANMVKGVSEGFQKRLLIYGTGYNCKLEGRKLHLNIGFMGRRRGVGSQFELKVPDGVEVQVETPAARGETDPAKLVIRGADRQKVGQFAAEIRSLRKAEPYKGKGVRYDNEVVRRKQGKALSGGG